MINNNWNVWQSPVAKHCRTPSFPPTPPSPTATIAATVVVCPCECPFGPTRGCLMTTTTRTINTTSPSSPMTPCCPHRHVTVVHDNCMPSTLPHHRRPQQLHASTPPCHRQPYVFHATTSPSTIRHPCRHVTVDPTTTRRPHRPHCHVNPDYHTCCTCHITTNVTHYPMAAPSFLEGCGRHVITLPDLAATRQMGRRKGQRG